MQEEDVEVRQLMAAAEMLLESSRSEVAIPVGMERPPFYNLDFLCPQAGGGVGGDLSALFEAWEVGGDVPAISQRKYAGRLVVLAKKMIRKMTDWYMNPLVRDVRKFNMLVARTLADVSTNLDKINQRLDELEKTQEELRRWLAHKEPPGPRAGGD